MTFATGDSFSHSTAGSDLFQLEPIIRDAPTETRSSSWMSSTTLRRIPLMKEHVDPINEHHGRRQLPCEVERGCDDLVRFAETIVHDGGQTYVDKGRSEFLRDDLRTRSGQAPSGPSFLPAPNY